MNASVEELLKRRRNRGVLVDTNILLLYYVGHCDPRLIASFKRTKQFHFDDFQLLLRLFDWFGSVITTPHILAEVNSLAGQLPHEPRRRWRLNFRNQMAALNEKPISSQVAVDCPQFLDVGLTDGGIIESARGKYLVLTDDLQLYVQLQTQSVESINFNHLRTLSW